MPYTLTDEEIRELWDRYGAGESPASLARRFNKHSTSINSRIRDAGGIRPHLAERGSQHLTADEREEISRGLAAGLSYRAIARQLGRAPSTVSREVAANGGPGVYRAARADRAAVVRRRRPKVCKLAASPRLRALVTAKLVARWSPEQVAGWLKRTYPGRPELQVSHETIYRSLFIQSRGALKHDLTAHLRTRRTVRRPGNSSKGRGSGKGQLVDTVHISKRPAEAEDRAVPGHWEGDLILGQRATGVGVLVERSTRFVMLLQLDGLKSVQVLDVLRRQIVTLPDQLRRSITWDQGKEMAQHAQFTIDTGIQIYFCDPRSPWQRGTAENTNGLLRQYLPRKSNLAIHTQHDLDGIAAELNTRPRKTLGFMTPSEKFAEAVAATP